MSFFPTRHRTAKLEDQVVLTDGLHSGCSIWAVELIRREIVRAHPDATNVNAVLIDFFLYDLAKEREALGTCDCPSVPTEVRGEQDFLLLAVVRTKSVARPTIRCAMREVKREADL